MRTTSETKAGVCLGCGRPLPVDRPAPNPHRVYHDESCRQIYERGLAAFIERHPELPGWGRSGVPRPGTDDRLRVTRTDGRLAVRFEKGPAKKTVREHHGTDTLPIAYYLGADAGTEDADAFLRQTYPKAKVVA